MNASLMTFGHCAERRATLKQTLFAAGLAPALTRVLRGKCSGPEASGAPPGQFKRDAPGAQPSVRRRLKHRLMLDI
jgi:hypothetical protein